MCLGSRSGEEGSVQAGGRLGKMQLPQRVPRPDVLKRAEETCCTEKREELGVTRTESGNVQASREWTPHIANTAPCPSD